jgi:hypothetical protein
LTYGGSVSVGTTAATRIIIEEILERKAETYRANRQSWSCGGLMVSARWHSENPAKSTLP